MICTTIINKDLEGVLKALEVCEMAEIRLDRCELSMKDKPERDLHGAYKSMPVAEFYALALDRMKKVAAREL